MSIAGQEEARKKPEYNKPKTVVNQIKSLSDYLPKNKQKRPFSYHTVPEASRGVRRGAPAAEVATFPGSDPPASMDSKQQSQSKGAADKRAASAAPTSGAPSSTTAAAGTSKTAKAEIDDIFSSAKRKAAPDASCTKPDEQQAGGKVRAEGGDGKASKAGQPPAAAASKKAKVEGSKDDIFGEQGKSGRKKTEEGFVIYTEDELGLGKKGGGDTPLCPFDCDCCY